MSIHSDRRRFVLIALAGISLVTGLWAGLARMGWLLPLPNEQFVIMHGPLMVTGFLGTLIGLERAVALQRWWAYGIPVCAGLSAITALFTVPIQISASLAVMAGILLIAVFITLYCQYPSEHFIVMALSALAWLSGNALWLADAAFFSIVPWWVGFLVLMIAGERLELSRLRQPTALIRRAFHGCVAVILIGLGSSLFDFPAAIRISGLGFLGLAAWLLRYDLAWQSARQSGLPRFMAISLIAGYMLRIAGDLAPLLWLQRWGGLLNAAAVLFFLVNNVRAVRAGAQASSIREH